MGLSIFSLFFQSRKWHNTNVNCYCLLEQRLAYPLELFFKIVFKRNCVIKKMLSHVIEIKELFDKKLMYDVQIEPVFYEMFGKTIKTDKWLRFEDWQQVYEKLDSMLGACVSPNLDDLSLDGFLVSNSIEVNVQKCPMKKAYWKIFCLDEKDLLPFILSIKVYRIDLTKLTRQLGQLKANKKHVNNFKTKKCKIEIRRDLYPEYNPLPVSPRDRSKIPAYKPYKPSARVDRIANTSEDQLENNEYYPKPISNCEPPSEEPFKDCYNPSTNTSGKKLVPTYIPSEIPKISNSLTDDEMVTLLPTNALSSESALSGKSIAKYSRNLRQRDLANGIANKRNSELSTSQGSDQKSRKRRLADDLEGGKIKYSQELFGSDDSDKESRKKEVKLSDPGESQDELKMLREGSESNLIEDKNYERSRKNRTRENSDDFKSKWSRKDDERTSNSDIRKKSKTLKAPKSESSSAKSKLSEEEQKILRDAHQNDIEVLNAYNEKLEALTRSPSPVKILKLNHLKCGDILNTFEGCRSMLDKHFKEFKRQKGYVVKKMEDLDPLMTINIVEEQKSLAMLNKLKEIYETDTENVPRYTDLFMELMLPEWILAIFMKEYNMSRLEAIRHIEVQNQIDDSLNSLG